jgi:hypothetical protein
LYFTTTVELENLAQKQWQISSTQALAQKQLLNYTDQLLQLFLLLKNSTQIDKIGSTTCFQNLNVGGKNYNLQVIDSSFRQIHDNISSIKLVPQNEVNRKIEQMKKKLLEIE